MNNPIKIAVAVILGLLALVAVFGSFYTVDEGERGVTTRYGEITGVAGPGLNFKMPILESVNHISVREHVMLYSDIEAYSRDQQPAHVDISVTYKIDSSRIEEVYSNYGDRRAVVDRQVTRKLMEQSKTVFGLFNAESAIRERGRLNAELVTAITNSITGPVIIVGVQVEDVSFSAAYENSVEQRMLAEVAVHKERQNLEREKVLADIVRTKARGDADKIREAALAEAEAISLRGNAEAEAITARAKALSSNAALIELVKAENWDGKLPVTMLPNSTVPFIDAAVSNK